MSQDVYALLDLNKKELLTLAGNAYKMVWEQILLLAISARQQYFNRDTHEGFHQRVKMVHILKKESSSSNSNENILNTEILRQLYKMLESECGSTKIIEYLLDDEKKNSPFSIKKTILREMEKNKIAFPSTYSVSTNYTRSYSYYSLYQILKYPIDFFKALLNIDNPIENFIDKIVIDVAKECIKKDNFYCLNAIFREIKITEDDVSFVLKNIHLIKDKKYVQEIIKGQIAISIGSEFTGIFNRLSDPFFGESNHKYIKPFSNVFQVTSKSDNLEISIKKELLITIININQLDELSKKIKSELKKVADAKEYNPRSIGFDNNERLKQSKALEMLSNWYQLSGTDIFSRLDQIPKIIASILEFDIRYFKGFFDNDFGFHSFHLTPNQQDHKQLPAKDIYTLVSLFIRNYLYYNDDRIYKYEYKNDINSYLIDDMSDREFSSISYFNNKMMEHWTTFDVDDYESMINRFKRLSPYLSFKSSKNIDEQIRKQQDFRKDKDAPAYPLDSDFSLPLWTNRHYIENGEQDS